MELNIEIAEFHLQPYFNCGSMTFVPSERVKERGKFLFHFPWIARFSCWRNDIFLEKLAHAQSSTQKPLNRPKKKYFHLRIKIDGEKINNETFIIKWANLFQRVNIYKFEKKIKYRDSNIDDKIICLRMSGTEFLTVKLFIRANIWFVSRCRRSWNRSYTFRFRAHTISYAWPV